MLQMLKQLIGLSATGYDDELWDAMQVGEDRAAHEGGRFQGSSGAV